VGYSQQYGEGGLSPVHSAAAVSLGQCLRVHLLEEGLNHDDINDEVENAISRITYILH
jgi:hypothetical protein